MTDRTAWRDLRRMVVRALDDEPDAAADLAAAPDLAALLARLAQVHAAGVVAAEEADALVDLSAAAASAHLGAAHRAADAARDAGEPLRAHVGEALAAEAGRPRVAALDLRAAWLAALVTVVDRLGLGACSRVDELAARRPAGPATRPRSRVAPALVAELEVTRLRSELPWLPPAPATPAQGRASWLFVPALRHVLGADVAVQLPAFWVDRQVRSASTWAVAAEDAAQRGAELPTELAWEAAARLLGPWFASGPRWEWCADAHDRRLLLRAGAVGAHAGRGDPAWRTARTLEALGRRRRVAAAAVIPDAGVRAVRRAAGGEA